MKPIMIVLMSMILNACGGSENAAVNATATPTTTGMTISSGTICSKVDTGISGIILGYVYESVIFTTGDRWVSCSVATISAQYSRSIFYKSGSSGATTGYCSVVADLDTASAGYWLFTSQGGISKTVYSDIPSTHNNYTYTFTSADCGNF